MVQSALAALQAGQMSLNQVRLQITLIQVWNQFLLNHSPVAETELYFKWLEVTGAVTKGAEWADRAGSTQFSDLIDPARGYSQAAQASAAAKIRTTAANRKLVKFHKDICSQWASSHYQAKQALLATQQRWTFSSLQNETLFSKRPFSTYNFCSMYFCKWCVERTWLRFLHLIFFQWSFVSYELIRQDWHICI